MPPPNPRFLYVRLPAELLDDLEAVRFHTSRRAGKRISTRALVHLALQDFIAQADASDAARQQLDARVAAHTDDSTESELPVGEP